MPVCPIGAMYGGIVHVHKAERAGARIIENAVVHRLEKGGKNRIVAALYKDPQEEVFWRSVRVEPSTTVARVRHRFRELDSRVQRVERYVTSSRFKLDRDFRDLEQQ